MYIIPHFLENEAKNFLKIKLSKIINDISDDIINNIFNPDINNKYQTLILNLDKNIKEKTLEILKEAFSVFDELYLNSEDRKKIFNISNSKCHRGIFTIFGYLEFERAYYYDKNDKNKHFYFIDNLFGLPRYDRYDKVVKAIAISNAIDTNQKKGANITNNYINSLYSTINNQNECNISRQDIYLWIDKWNVPEVEYDCVDSDNDTLYIMIDEKYIHEQIKMLVNKENKNNKTKIEEKNSAQIINETLEEYLHKISDPPLMLPAPKEKSKNFIMSKAFITFTDIFTKNKRRTLQNKVTFLTSSKDPWNEFMDFIPRIFDFKKIKNIKVLSDAGSWITAGISNLKLFVDNIVIPCLCYFHAKQKVNRSTKDENIRRLLYNCIDDNKKDDFNKLFNTLLKDKNDKRLKTLKSYKHYIIVHWDAIQNMQKSKIKSSMESHISHNVAKYFSYEPKAYSGRHIQKLLKLRQHKENGINITSLYLKTCNNKEIVTIKKDELSFSLFERNSSNLPLLYTANNYTNMALRGLVA